MKCKQCGTEVENVNTDGEWIIVQCPFCLTESLIRRHKLAHKIGSLEAGHAFLRSVPEAT